MVTQINKNIIKALAVCTGFFSLASCREHSVTPTSGLVPEVDNIHTFAMNTGDFNIQLHNRLSDSIITSTYYLTGSTNISAIGLGTYVDPFFGRTTASAYLQVTPYKSGFAFPSGSIMDSAVLVFPYLSGTTGAKSYGDTTKALQLNVYRTTAKVEVSGTYYSNSVLPIEATPIGSGTIPFTNYKSSSKIATATKDTLTAQLRLKLNNSFAQEIRNADTANFLNTTAFQEYLKGLYITPDITQAGGLLSYFLIPSVSSGDQKNLAAARLEFYYHTADTVLMSSFPLKTDVCGYFTNYNRNYTGYPAANYLNKNSDSVLIQSEPGFATEVTITGLMNIPLAVINKAEMVFTAVNLASPDNIFTPIDVLTPVLMDNGQEMPLYEVVDNNGNTNSSGSLFVNPYAQKKTIAGIEYTQYRINIPRTLQHARSEGKNAVTIRLRGSKNYPGMFRVLAPGIGAGGETNFQFNLIYTKQQQ